MNKIYAQILFKPLTKFSRQIQKVFCSQTFSLGQIFISFHLNTKRNPSPRTKFVATYPCILNDLHLGR
jgi:hypothetical protein